MQLRGAGRLATMMVKLEPVKKCSYGAMVARNEFGGADIFALAVVGL